MKGIRNQRGMGAVEVLLILVVVGILGFTGYFVWHSQQSTSKTLDQTAKTDSSASAPATSQTKTAAPKMLSATMDPSIGKQISFSYPDTWKLDKGALQHNPYTVQKFTVTSPSGKLSVVYETSNGGLGGACIPSEQGTLTTFSTESLADYPAATYVETTFTNGMMDGAVDFAGLMHTAQLNGATKAAKGGSYCDIYLANIIPLYENSDSSAHLSAELTFADATIQKDAAKFTAALSGAEYTEAKAILLSTTVK